MVLLLILVVVVAVVVVPTVKLLLAVAVVALVAVLVGITYLPTVACPANLVATLPRLYTKVVAAVEYLRGWVLELELGVLIAGLHHMFWHLAARLVAGVERGIRLLVAVAVDGVGKALPGCL
jgi:hypothetical protein